MPKPTPRPRQSRKPSVESQKSVDSQCELEPTTVPVSRELVAEFDPLTASTLQASPADDSQNILDELAGNANDLAEANESESLRLNVAHAGNRCSDTHAADPSCNGRSQALLTSAKAVHRDVADCEWTELNLKPHPMPDCSSPDAADAGKCVNGSSFQLHDGRRSYLEMWNCSSSHHAPHVIDTDKPSDDAVLQPEIIKSDESFTLQTPLPQSRTCSVGEYKVFSSPPKPKERSLLHLSTSDQSLQPSDLSPGIVPTRAAPVQPLDPSPRIVPTRAAPLPPSRASEVAIQAGIFERSVDEDTLTAEDENAADGLTRPGSLPAPESSLQSVSSSVELPRPHSTMEQQMLSVSFQSSCDVGSSLPVSNVSFPPRPRPRNTLRLPSVPSEHVYSPSPSREPLLRLQKSPPSPLDKAFALDTSNRGSAADRSNSKASTSSEVFDSATPETVEVVTSPSSIRTPPPPPPKHRKPSDLKNSTYLLVTAWDDDTTDDDLDGVDKNSKFLTIL